MFCVIFQNIVLNLSKYYKAYLFFKKHMLKNP